MKSKFPIYDKRDGARDEDLQFKTIREILGLQWNIGLERAIEHCALDHASALRRLRAQARKQGETIMAAMICNYAVVILVESPNAS